MGPGERQTPARGQGVENILGLLERAVGSATFHQFAHYR